MAVAYLGREPMGAEDHEGSPMRSVTVFLIGVGSMVAASGAFALAMADESPISAPPWLVPAVVVVAGALAARVDRRPRGLATVLGGACATVVGYAGWLRLTQGPGIEWIPLALIGLGLAVAALSIGFGGAVYICWLGRQARR